MNIKQASEISGISADTIRYYERIGIIPAIKRSTSGIRNFDDEDLKWLQFSRQMRTAGVSIEALIEYIQLFQMGDQIIDARVHLLNEQKMQLDEKIKSLVNATDRLAYKIDNYQTHMIQTEKNLRPFNNKTFQ